MFTPNNFMWVIMYIIKRTTRMIVTHCIYIIFILMNVGVKWKLCLYILYHVVKWIRTYFDTRLLMTVIFLQINF